MKTKIGAVSALAAAVLGLAAGDAAAQVQNGVLTINGTAGADTLALRLQSGVPGTLELDIGDDGTVDQSYDRSTFTAVIVDARGGDDIVRVGPIVDEAITVDGGGGADTLTASSGDQTLIGGSGNDIVTGGFGNDTALLGSGADLYTWTPGGGSDVVEGQGGSDELDFDTSNVSETVDISANGSRVQLLRNVASIDMDLDGLERIGVDVLGGSDTVVAGDLSGTAVETVAVGLGVFGAGDGVADSVIVGATTGADSLTVGNAGDALAVSGVGAEVQVSGGEAHDEINLGTGEGDDTVTTNVGVTGAALIDVDGGPGTDTARYEGTAEADAIHVVSNGAKVRTGGLSSAPFDTIVEDVHVRGLGGDDTMTATGNVAALSHLTFDGGAGGDNLRGGNGADLLLGGSGNDLVDGNQGQDVAELGSGADRFQWDPGDSNDTVEGESGDDAVEFNGSSIGEAVALTANGPRTVLTRNIANIAMDTGGIEAFALRVLGGADTITVNDLAGTGVDSADVELNADGVADSVIANGTGGDDAVRVSRSGAEARVRGLAAETRVTGGEPAFDVLRVQTLAGDDEITIASNLSDLIGLAVDLGADD